MRCFITTMWVRNVFMSQDTAAPGLASIPWLVVRLCFYAFFYLLRATWHKIREFIALPCPTRVEQKLVADSDPETVNMICGRVDG